MTDQLERSKVILAEAQVLLDAHDRRYHPEYFDETGNRKKEKAEMTIEVCGECKSEVEEILACEYLVGQSPVDSECDFEACENCLDKHTKDHEYEGDCARGDRHQEYEPEDVMEEKENESKN